MIDGKLEPGDRVTVDGEEREIVSVWSGKDLVMPYPLWRVFGGDQERSALFAYTPDRKGRA